MIVRLGKTYPKPIYSSTVRKAPRQGGAFTSTLFEVVLGVYVGSWGLALVRRANQS